MRKILTTLAAVMFISFSAYAITIHVPSQYPTIQAGINAAVNGDTVLVADGTYTGTGNKDIDFLGKTIVVISENGPDSCIIDCEADGRGFYFHSDEDSTSVLCGFTVTNGYVEEGGGINCENSSPMIANCIILANEVTGYSSCGGGIYCYYSNPVITDCMIIENTVGISGGGIYCDNSHPVISNCAISDNVAEGDGVSGGGICLGNSNPIIVNCTISGNSATSIGWELVGAGGGISCWESSPTIDSCDIYNNSCYGEKYSYGGGIHCWHSNATISNCNISQNSATGYANLGGGGIYCWESSPLISYCSVSENRVEPDGGGGGISMEYSPNPIIEYCTIYGNYAEPGGGGGIRWWHSDPILRNVTISGNTVASGGGGGIYCGYYSNPSLVNIIVEGNYGDCGVYFYYSATAEFFYGDFYNNEGGNFTGDVPPGLGEIATVNTNGDSCDIFYNIFEDPLFEDPLNGNFQITWANFPVPDSTKSPCIDAGDPESPLDPDSTIADIGALYFDQGTAPPISITLTPYNSPIVIPPGGDAFAYNIAGVNNGSEPAVFDVWVNIEVPGGYQFTILEPVYNLTLEAGSSIERDRTIFVPGNAPAGEYICIGMIGTYPWNVIDSDAFPFIKEGADGIWQGSEGWVCSGEPFPGEDVTAEEALPEKFALHSAFPNPFNPVTNLTFDLPEAGKVSLIVYDVMGREVVRLVDEWTPGGTYQMTFDAATLSSGIYFARLVAGDFQQTRKIILLK